jgi:hypothetical protein
VSASVQQPDDCFKAPDVIGDSGGDPRRHVQRSMVKVYCEDVIESWSSPKSPVKARDALVFSTPHRSPLLLSLVPQSLRGDAEAGAPSARSWNPARLLRRGDLFDALS